MPSTKENASSESTEQVEETKKNSDKTEETESSSSSKNGTEEHNTEEKKDSDEADKDKLISEANTLLAQGKRHLFVKDYPSAVTALGDACSKISEIYGEVSDECADAYFNYGCALLELAREESGVLEVENKDKESEESEEGEEETEAAEEGKKEDDNNEKDAKDAEQKNDDKTENKVKDKTADEKVEGDEENKEEEEEEEEEEEDVNNLQLAWEMFELAKVIFQRQKDEMKLAETFLRLGEVALESENYGSAITDIQNCLELQKKVLPPVSREIAETLFQLGIACSLCNQFDEAIKHFTSAGVLLERRIQNLTKMTEPEPEKAKNPFYSISNEIEEIKALLPEIKDKIADMEEFKNETMKAVLQATINNTGKVPADGAGPSTNGTSTASSSTSSKAPANDISHLVRKKRKPLDETSNDPKKPRTETKST
ncbi:protein HGV2-like isoform X2 [Lycorma delicatula]